MVNGLHCSVERDSVPAQGEEGVWGSGAGEEEGGGVGGHEAQPLQEAAESSGHLLRLLSQ